MSAPVTPPPQPSPSPPAPPAPAGFRLSKPISLVGAAIAAGSVFLPWLDVFSGSANAFDVPVQFLFDYQTNKRGARSRS